MASKTWTSHTGDNPPVHVMKENHHKRNYKTGYDFKPFAKAFERAGMKTV